MTGSQPDLFDHATRAAQLRDTGMALAIAAQDNKLPAWSELAYAAIVSLAKRQPTVHVDDVLREFPLRPDHPNAWGAVWMRAIKNGVIFRSGESRPCLTDCGKHRHVYPVYRSGLWR